MGHSLDVLGLAGNGFTMKPEGHYLLVGGGIGIPPMLGCAQYTQGKSTAILGGRSADKIILQNCFQDECAKVLTATDDGSLGHHGFVDALVRQELEGDQNYDAVLACGPRPMLRNVARVAVRCPWRSGWAAAWGPAWCAPATWPTAAGSTYARTGRSLIPGR